MCINLRDLRLVGLRLIDSRGDYLVNIIHNFWVLGGGQVSCDWWSWSHNTQYSSLIGQEVLCRLSGSSQSTFVMFSSLSVVMIAVDRYNIIINDRSVSIPY